MLLQEMMDVPKGRYIQEGVPSPPAGINPLSPECSTPLSKLFLPGIFQEAAYVSCPTTKSQAP